MIPPHVTDAMFDEDAKKKSTRFVLDEAEDEIEVINEIDEAHYHYYEC
jgi:uncharacterized small protein (DUF1192 family)